MPFWIKHWSCRKNAMTHTALPCSALPHMAKQAPAMQFTAILSKNIPSIVTARPNQLGFFGAPSLNVQGTQFQGSYMPNPGWQLSPREQML